MHSRVSTLQLDPDKVDETIQQLENEDLPKLKEVDGFKGFTLQVDRSSGKAVGISYWEDEAALSAAEEVGKEARDRAAQTGGATGEPQVDRYEVAIDTMA